MSIDKLVNDEMAKKRFERTLIIPDIHAPYEDYRALHAIYKMAKKEDFDKVKIMGDLVDFYQLSKFSKDPKRITGLQQEIDVAQYHLDKLRKVHKGDITLFEGNHEYRLKKYLMENPEMSSLKKINNIPSLLDLDEYGIKYKHHEMFHGILIKHGNLVRQQSAYTAKGEFDREGTSGISGHTHRLGSYYVSNRGGAHAWFEMGHLCDEKAAEYMEGKVPNWQKGFGVMTYDTKTDTWRIEQVPIVKNSFMFNNNVYKWRSNQKYVGRERL